MYFLLYTSNIYELTNYQLIARLKVVSRKQYVLAGENLPELLHIWEFGQIPKELYIIDHFAKYY